MRRLRKIWTKFSRLSWTLLKSQCHIGTISTRSTLTSNKATMSQPTSLTRGSRISLKDASTQTEEKLVHRTELLFHATKHFEVKKWVRSKKQWEDITYQALLQYALRSMRWQSKISSMPQVERRSCTANWQLSTPSRCLSKMVRKDTKTSGSYRTSSQSTCDSKTCSKCNTTHQFKDCPAFGKKCHKCGFKNHFSLCCRSSSQQLDKTLTDAEVEHQDTVGALRDATDPAEAGTPGPGHDQGAVHRLGMPTASK